MIEYATFDKRGAVSPAQVLLGTIKREIVRTVKAEARVARYPELLELLKEKERRLEEQKIRAERALHSDGGDR